MKCCDITAGMLRTPCQFQRKVKVSDGAGGWSEAWLNLSGAATRCKFKALSGGERFQAQRAEATTRNRILCRFFAGLSETDGPSSLSERDRVVIDGRAYNIRFINNIEMRNKFLEIDIDGGGAS